MACVDPGQRALDCERLMRVLVADHSRQYVLAKLHAHWLSLGSERDSMSRAEFDQKFDDVTELHDILLEELVHLH